MKDNQHEQLITDLTPEQAAVLEGGTVTVGGSNPDIILYQDVNRKGLSLKINATSGDGIANLRGFNFNDKTSSFRIVRGTWAFYEDADYKDFKEDLGPGIYNVSAQYGVPNDKLSSLKRIS